MRSDRKASASADAVELPTETLKGTVGRIFSSNPEGPWMAGVLRLDDGNETKFSGKVCAQAGDKLELSGSWVMHPKFGRQFEAATGLVRMDESPDALAHLLATDDRFTGLGPVRARKLVDAALALSSDGSLGAALKDSAAEISARSGVSPEIVANAAEVWNSKRSYFDALATLVEQGWSNAQAQTIVHTYGENAATIVRADPYMLIGKIARFGFRTVDAIARKMGVASTDPGRLEAGVAFCLDRIGDEGHTWTTKAALLSAAREELRPDTLDGEAAIADALEKMISLGEIHMDLSPVGTEIVADARIVKTETQVFERLMAGLGDPCSAADIEQRLQQLDEATRTISDDTLELPPKPILLDGPRAVEVLKTLNVDQTEALHGFANFRFGVISGSAGTGKSYLMRAVCEVAEECNLRVMLCAPTGKAARRLYQSTARDAKTIHRTLETMMDEETRQFRFTRHEGNPLDCDLLIVDEWSMCDAKLCRSLLAAIDPTTRVLFVGDHNQIPSVSAGAILRDILSAQKNFPGAIHILNKVVRQAGILARNTTAILSGVVAPQSVDVWRIQRTERGHEEGSAALCAMAVEKAVTEVQAPFMEPLDLGWDVQVLAPMKKGPLGTYALNVHLQKLRQRLLGNPEPPAPDKDRPPKPLPGDRVIWTVNDYNLNLFNGTQALVVALKKNGAMDLFTEEGKEVTIPSGKRKHVEVAYALTIHKCVAGDTLIETAEDGWIQIDELHRQCGRVGTISGSEKFTASVKRSVGKLLQIECESGYRLKVTPDHKVRVFCQSKREWVWRKACDISEGDFLRLRMFETTNDERRLVRLPDCPEGNVRAKDISTPPLLTDDVAEFFGLMVGDGTRYKAGCRLSKRYQDVVDRFAVLVEKLFGLEPHHGFTLGTPMVEFNSTVMSDWLRIVGGMEPNRKAVPSVVMRSSRSVRAKFLRGLFEDGTVNVKSGFVDHVEWCNRSESLVQTVQTLLLEFGIISSTTTRRVGNGKRHSLSSLYIYGDGICLFRDMIGFICEAKNARLRNNKIAKTRRWRIPIDRDDFSCSTYTGSNARQCGYVSRTTAAELGMQAELQYHYVRAKSISESSGPSYCLTVPRGGSFLQNRFDGANSQGSQWPFVIAVISSSHYIMRDRNLLYTAISRASEAVVIFGDAEGVRSFASHKRSQARQTFGSFLVHGWRPTMPAMKLEAMEPGA